VKHPKLVSTVVISALLGASQESAADTATRIYSAPPNGKARTYVKGVVPDWTGFYIGLNGGGAFGSTGADTFGLLNATPNLFGSNDTFHLAHNLSGGFGGAQAGFNRQTGNWVSGVEADIQGGSINGSRTISGAIVDCLGIPACGAPGNFATASEKIDLFGTIRARAGFLATPTLLIYGTGGLAWAELSTSGDYRLNLPTPFDYQASNSGFKAGWAAGAGLEYKLTSNWSIKGEYLYYDLGNSSVTSNFGVPATPTFQSQYNFNTHGSLARIGLNYLWGTPAVDRWVTGVYAAGKLLKAVAAPPVRASSWNVEFGARYFYSSGSTRHTLGDPFVAGQVNSRLTYQNLDSNAGEGFARLDHTSGLFAKGFIGGGNIFRGSLNDEDFPPGTTPYSNTSGSVNNGSLWYGTFDAGYNVWKTSIYKLGAFIGYNHFYENVNSYGCAQVASNPGICGVPTATSVLGISETENWDSLRIGVNGVISLDKQWKVTLDGAYLPYVRLNGLDNHWARPDINPLPESGSGWGYQLEGLLAYEIVQNFSVGVGGRYWFARTNNGTTQFPSVPPSPTIYNTDRYGGFVQASYKFGE
jgi:opacity protein-like surface antigen